jgi:two-component system, cell cycle sensor histidine kinase and response regulator CckA
LVEDEDIVRKLARRILVHKGYQVLVAENEQMALELCQKHGSSIDLLLTDVIMPNMNGRDLFAKIKALFHKIEVLFMSGHSENVVAHHGVLDEGINFISKPFTIEGLAQKVREVLDRPGRS